MSETAYVQSYGNGSKIGLVNLVLNTVILLVLAFHFLGHHHHHFWAHRHGGYGYGAMGYHHPFPGRP